MSIAGILFLTFLFVAEAQAEWRITQVKGRKFIATGDVQAHESGEELFLSDPATGKKRAKVRITRVRGDRLLGEILRGRMQTGETLEPALDLEALRTPPVAVGRYWWGGGAGFRTTTMQSIIANTTVSMTGSGLVFDGTFGWFLTPSWRLRILASYVPLKVSGTVTLPICTNSATCSAEINYLALRPNLDFVLPLGAKWDLAAGGGMGLYLPMTKSSNILDANKIAFTQTYEAAVGVDYKLSAGKRIHALFEYIMFPSSDTVKLQQMGLSVGMSVMF